MTDTTEPRPAGSFATLAERRAWLATLPANDNAPRKAAPKPRPRHAGLATKLRSLLTWRAISAGADWTQVADNDNAPDDGGPALLDSEHEVRPRISEIREALKGVEFAKRRHAKLGGGGGLNVVPVDGDMERGAVLSQRKKPECVVRLGTMRFSNGEQVERGLKLRDGQFAIEDIRLPLGALVDMKGYRARDRFGKAKRSTPKDGADEESTFTPRRPATPAAFQFVDPVAELQEAARVRSAVKPETAEILDLALRAANFREIGEALGYRAKQAERRGKAAVLASCKELDEVLAA